MPSVRSKKTSYAKKPLPGLVFSTIKLSKLNAQKKKKSAPSTDISSIKKFSNRDLPTSDTKNYSQLLLWGSVASSFMIILVISGLALKTKYSSLNWFTTPEKTLIDKSTYSWNQAEQATKFKSDIEQEIKKAEVKDVLSTFLITTTSPSSNAPETQTTSTSSTLNSKVELP